MLVLSLDIDFFVDPIAHDEEPEVINRLSDDDYSTDSNANVTTFLENQCLLTLASPVPGIAIRDHDAAWDVLHYHTQSSGPVTLVHVDAHSDLGLGDSGYSYLLTNWLRASPRPVPERALNKMNLGNWLAFAAAGGLVQEIEFIPRNHPPQDLFPYYLNSQAHQDATALVFRDVTKCELIGLASQENPLNFLHNKRVLHSLPWKTTPKAAFKMTKTPDFVIVCQSPQFTPPSADQALTLARRYITESDLGLGLMGPI